MATDIEKVNEEVAREVRRSATQRNTNQNRNTIFSTVHTFGNRYKVFEITKDGNSYFIEITSGIKGDPNSRQTIRMKLNDFEVSKMILDLFASFIR